ncbi:MAG TPA: hypothetical protein VFD84_11055 [Candidatus Binatia bacterium]|nr:hypothetical protein [Candidatus Binatia bacterium]
MTPEEQLRGARATVAVPAALAPARPAAGAVAWSAVWSGFFVAVGTLVLLLVLGAAIGASVLGVAPWPASNPRAWGVGTALWTFASAIVALAAGGRVAGRYRGGAAGRPRAIEGVLVWVLSVLSLALVGSVTVDGMAIGRGLALPRATKTTIVTGPPLEKIAPAVSAAIAARDVDGVIALLGQPATADRIASATGQAHADVEVQLADLRARVAARRTDRARALAEARVGLARLAAAPGRVPPSVPPLRAMRAGVLVAWAAFVALLLSLLAAVAGARAGSRRAVAA